MSVIQRFLGQSLPNPATAAAVAVLSARPAALHTTSALDGLTRGLSAVAPHLTSAERAAWAAAMAGPLAKAGITAPRCVAAFLGQCAVESDGFLALEENLSYSAERLCQVWPGRFPTVAAADACVFQPEMLANQVYADRMGNGNVQSGDGWRFRGRGLIQISGRANYERYATAMNLALDKVLQNAATQAGAVESAAWFWKANRLNELAEAWSIDLLTRKINGGTTDAAQRSRLCEAALRAIGE